MLFLAPEIKEYSQYSLADFQTIANCREIFNSHADSGIRMRINYMFLTRRQVKALSIIYNVYSYSFLITLNSVIDAIQLASDLIAKGVL